MTTFTGTSSADSIIFGQITGFTGGGLAELNDTIGDIFICDPSPSSGANDYVFAGTGDDLIMGGLGPDQLFGSLGNDTIYGNRDTSPDGDATNDLLDGGSGNDVLVGSAGNDVLIGRSGDDSLTGGLGTDYMVGGEGNDTYAVDQAAEAFENPGEGIDHVFASLNYTLGPNLEYLTLTGTGELTGKGNGLANWITGNNSANKLFGLGGNDILQGLAGSDTLFGGDGDDALYADSILFGFDNLVNVLHGEAGNDNLVGSGGNDVLRGGSGNDHLAGGGGTDKLIGGIGNDTYDVVTSTAGIIEKAGEGIDVVNATGSCTLGANLENLNLTGLIGDFDGTGNGLRNTIVGNPGANLLRGFGGNDVLKGGFGNDELRGGDGNDTLSGGDGVDTLIGGNGSDIVVFDTALNVATNVDAVIGFVPGTDRIHLDNAVFAGLPEGALPASAFRLGAAADANDRIIYNNTTGALFFDADGNGPTGPVQFATFVNAPALSASDFVVI